MTASDVQRAYGARAEEYAHDVGHMDAVAEPDRELVHSWARSLAGPVLDVGCGPGHWTAHLHEHGVDITGVDITPEFVTHARAAHSGVRFRDGHAARLDVPDDALGGVLAWYSLIHSTSAEVIAALDEFARAIRPGGGLLLEFFEGPAFEPFDHAITTAYRWPIDALSDLVQHAGFAVTETHARTDPPSRPHGALAAIRMVG